MLILEVLELYLVYPVRTMLDLESSFSMEYPWLINLLTTWLKPTPLMVMVLMSWLISWENRGGKASRQTAKNKDFKQQVV